MRTIALSLSAPLLFLILAPDVFAQDLEIVIPISEKEANAALRRNQYTELNYEDRVFASSGRIRIAKLNSDALLSTNTPVTFTPFADVEPIVLVSQGLGGEYGHTWTGARVSNRVDEDPALLEAIEKHPETPKGVMPQIHRMLYGTNTVELKLQSYLVSPGNNDYLLSPDLAEHYLINPNTGWTHPIESVEQSYSREAKRLNIADPCKDLREHTRKADEWASKAPERDRMMEELKNRPLPELPPQANRPVNPDQKDSRFGFYSAGEAAPEITGARLATECEASGNLVERIAALRENNKVLNSYRDDKFFSPLPSDAQTVFSASGSIADDAYRNQQQRGPDQKQGGRYYTISPLSKNPQYVIIYESDPTRRAHPKMDMMGEDVEAWKASDAGKRNAKIGRAQRLHMDKAKARIAARDAGENK